MYKYRKETAQKGDTIYKTQKHKIHEIENKNTKQENKYKKNNSDTSANE